MARLTKTEKEKAVRKGVAKGKKFSPGGVAGTTQKIGGIFTPLAQKFGKKVAKKVSGKNSWLKRTYSGYEKSAMSDAAKRNKRRKIQRRGRHDIRKK